MQLAFRGHVNEAREIFGHLRARYDERGDVQSSRLVQQLLCDMELRAGNARDAADLVAGLDIELSWMSGVIARLHASLAALIGDPSAVSEWSSMAFSAAPGQGWDRLATHRALGVAALLQADATTAVEHLQLVWDHANREGVDDPGALPVAADLGEAFILLGDYTSAQRVSDRLMELSTEQDHPWGLATARRTTAALQLAHGDLEGSVQELERVARDYGEWGLRFDQARTLLLLGNFQRRLKQRAAARRSLEGAIDVFKASGCTGWATRARADHGRVSGRRATVEGALTPSEMQVAQLAAGGLTNREIAERLFVTVSTVEVHLSHVYAKYGVTSRTQLARDMQLESTL